MSKEKPEKPRFCKYCKKRDRQTKICSVKKVHVRKKAGTECQEFERRSQ